MRIAAIYARFSSDLQNPCSTQDQVRVCREYISQRFPDVNKVIVYTDDAISGQTMERKGIQQLLTLVHKQSPYLVVTESIDRLSRKLRDMVDIFEQLMNNGVKLYTVQNGSVDFVQMGIRGTMSSAYIQEMMARVRRGQRGKIERGLAAGGLSYGYRVVRDQPDHSGRLVSGQRAIVPDKAKIVIDIFTMYAAGLSAKAIATELNSRNIPSPRQRQWVAGTILSILSNEIYCGTLVWNRTSLSRKPHRYITNPPEDWVISHRSDLRIVSDKLWDAAEKNRRSSKKLTPRHGRRSPDGISILVHCAVCGGRHVHSDRRLLVCGEAKTRKTCKNYRRVAEATVIDAVLKSLKAEARKIGNWHMVIDHYNAQGTQDVRDARKQLTLNNEKLTRMLDAIENGVRSDEALERVKRLEEESDDLKLRARLDDQIHLTRDPKEIIQNALVYLKSITENLNSHYVYRYVLPVIIEKVVSTPKSNSHFGSDLTVHIKSDQWPKFLHAVESLWEKSSPNKK